MKFKILIFIMVLSTSIKANTLMKVDDNKITTSEKTFKKNSVYFELLGSSLIYNLAYDRIIIKKGIHNISLGLGGEYLDIEDMKYNLYLTPKVNYFIGAKNNFLLFGINTTFSFAKTEKPHMAKEKIASLNISYRFQKANGGLFCQAGLSFKGVISKDFFDGFFWPGVAIGYTF